MHIVVFVVVCVVCVRFCPIVSTFIYFWFCFGRPRLFSQIRANFRRIKLNKKEAWVFISKLKKKN